MPTLTLSAVGGRHASSPSSPLPCFRMNRPAARAGESGSNSHSLLPCRLCEGVGSVNICKLWVCVGMVLLGVNSLNIGLHLTGDWISVHGNWVREVVTVISGIQTNGWSKIFGLYSDLSRMSKKPKLISVASFDPLNGFAKRAQVFNYTQNMSQVVLCFNKKKHLISSLIIWGHCRQLLCFYL